MTTKLNPYISFRDNARQAMEFYHSVFGGTLSMNTFKEFQASPDPSEDDKLMHAQIDTPGGLTLMGSDVPNSMEYQEGARITITLSGEDEAELRGYFEKLSDGAAIEQPLEKAPWGDIYGMLEDKFGVHWMVNISQPAG